MAGLKVKNVAILHASKAFNEIMMRANASSFYVNRLFLKKYVFREQESSDYKKSEEGIEPTHIHGGFGYLTRREAELLAELGHEVHVIAPSSAYALDEGPRTSAYGQYYLHLFNDLQGSGSFHQVKAFYRMMTHNPELLEVLKSVDPDVVQLENVSDYTTTVAKFTDNALYVFQDPWDDDDIRILIEAYKEYYGLIGGEYNHGTYDALRRIFNMRLGSILRCAGGFKAVGATQNRERDGPATFLSGASYPC